ncbi:acyl-CoA synthetase [Halorarius litoreus]|uniref:acyl-CoA synthetase n=1 Tax=Halorarius litoreus TaxID=2962676 RepID=UPI0020CF3195|nr:AMP-binding protein [Halorarius litoreus]
MPSVPDIEAYTFYEEEWDSYEELVESFEHDVPERFNLATYLCDRWADDKGRVAIFGDGTDEAPRTFTYWQLRQITNRLANYLQQQGIERGDRVAVNVPQKPETAMAHLAAWKLGAVSVPLSSLFGPDALSYRLRDSGAKALVVDAENVDTVRDVRASLDDLETVLTVGAVDHEADETDFWTAQDGASHAFDTVDTAAEDTASIIYTSGTTGDPKGVVHAHRLVLGLLPDYLASYCNFQLDERDVIWSPADWAWVAGLYSTMATTLYHGRPVVAYNATGKFDPVETFELVERYGISVSFIPPTALRMMMQETEAAADYDLTSLRSIWSGGESLGDEISEWAEDTFEGAVVHEVYGQTEAVNIVNEISTLYPKREGALGKPSLGRLDVALFDAAERDQRVGVDEVGEIAVKYEGDPECFKGYWNKPEATAETVQNDWLFTGDLAKRDADGYYYFVGRNDDVIISAGYRIGPKEVEDVLAGHPAVVNVGVIGVPDDLRGAVPKAFVELGGGYEPSDALVEELQQRAKDALAQYEYPREIEFVDALPLTVTGKVRRNAIREQEGIE